ncbi:MAG: hypothetical protein IIV67_07220 [Bacteroidaceae bacterium]|nr:hypothetical protein [Bacteroidaceae bacterium]
MKKITLALLTMLAMQTASAQSTKYVFTSSQTLNTKPLTEAGQAFQLNRTLLAGYNTICLPVSLDAEQLQAAAKDVQLERLVSIKQEGDVLNLYFMDCTKEGMQAGVPYLIYSPIVQNLKVKSGQCGATDLEIKNITLNDDNGNQVTFNSSWTAIQAEGRYGIPAQQDAYILESVLIRTDADKTFLPTRCGFIWNKQSVTATSLNIKHVTSMSGIETSIAKLQAAGTKVDIYDTKGALVKKQTTVSDAISTLPTGIYVIGGEKFAVK